MVATCGVIEGVDGGCCQEMHVIVNGDCSNCTFAARGGALLVLRLAEARREACGAAETQTPNDGWGKSSSEILPLARHRRVFGKPTIKLQQAGVRISCFVRQMMCWTMLFVRIKRYILEARYLPVS